MLAGLVLVGASLALPGAVSADTAAPLTGEFLLSDGVAFDVTATCSATGTSTISYAASGAAFGPYPGTFTEVGTVTIGQTTTADSAWASRSSV